MAKINKIVTSQVQARITADRIDPNTYSYGINGILTRHDENRVGRPVVGPGILYGSGNDSGDGAGRDTIKLIPDENLGTDQYIIIDPTAPNHIHIRAGGTQDASNADLFLGAEDNNVVVSDTGNTVTINATDKVHVYGKLQLNNSLILTAAAPANSYGQAGDLQGMVAFDSTHIYYCVSDYVDNSTNIWKRVQLTGGAW